MRIRTKRLMLIPLELQHLRQAVVSRGLMVEGLGLVTDLICLDEMMARIYAIKIANIEKDPMNYLFHTYWQIALRRENRIIGEIGFKGIPDEWGRIEVGYGVQKEYRNKGYVTESLQGLTDWAFIQKEVAVEAIIAATDKGNLPSQRVLTKVGAVVSGQNENYYFWKISAARFPGAGANLKSG